MLSPDLAEAQHRLDGARRKEPILPQVTLLRSLEHGARHDGLAHQLGVQAVRLKAWLAGWIQRDPGDAAVRRGQQGQPRWRVQVVQGRIGEYELSAIGIDDAESAQAGPVCAGAGLRRLEILP